MIPACMSDKVSIISDAADDATAANNGGGGTQQGSEEGKEPHSAQGETQVHNPQTAHRTYYFHALRHHSCHIVCGLFYCLGG